MTHFRVSLPNIVGSRRVLILVCSAVVSEALLAGPFKVAVAAGADRVARPSCSSSGVT